MTATARSWSSTKEALFKRAQQHSVIPEKQNRIRAPEALHLRRAFNGAQIVSEATIKKIINGIKNRDIRHAALQKAFPRVIIGLTLAYLWNTFLNSSQRLSIYGHCFMAIGLIFVGLAWLCYLRLDGVNAPKLFKSKLFQKPPKRKMGDMIDFVDEEVISYEELDSDGRTVASLISNIIAAILFLIPCMVFYIIN